MRKLIGISLFVLGAWLLPPASLRAQGPPEKPPCSDPGYRQFDFWIGDWEVYVGEELAGTNKVERILGNCVIQENWEGTAGSMGKSFNSYNQETGAWTQIWVDNAGNTYTFSGSYQDNVMSMRGEAEKRGHRVDMKLTFTNQPESGTIRQVWEMSRDSSKTWNTIFDGLYKPRKSPGRK